jgi:N-acetylglucosaminyldiphosphoundecaprenol N-acetyl-beta-D-mannosaminyltransferase
MLSNRNNGTPKPHKLPHHPTVSLFGVRISKLDMPATVAYLSEAVRTRSPHQVVTVNPIIMMNGLDQPTFMSILQRAELIVPDGTGVVWATRHIGSPVAERVTGFDLVHQLMEVGNQNSWTIFLLGASPETIKEAHHRLAQQYPSVKLISRDGYFGEAEDAEVINMIQKANPDILFVGRSTNTQEPWIDRYRTELNIPVMMGVGGSFDVISGNLRRAPKLFQKLQLEWLFRLIRQPWRYRRMLDLPRFAWKVLRNSKSLRAQETSQETK